MILLEVQREQVDVSQEELRRQETLYEIGSARLSNALSARSQLQRDKVSLISRENTAAIARSNLSFVLGLVLATVYRWTHQSFSYARSFLHTMVLATIVITIMIVTG